MNEHECCYCKKRYREKYAHDRHITTCEFFYKSKHELNYMIETAEERIPTNRELYSIMQEMLIRINRLEDENKKSRHIQNTKINVLEWLNDSMKPKKTLAKFINEDILPNVSKYLETVFDENLIVGVTKAIESAISTYDMDELPMRTFENKPNQYFIFKKDTESNSNMWVQITSNQFDKYISLISSQFLLDFYNIWCVENKHKIETDEDFKDIHITYNRKIIGTGMGTEENRNKRIRESLNKRIMTDVKSIVEYNII